jgi:phospholipid/cholesterol/gamma-HCH transport system ATP-binding protein
MTAAISLRDVRKTFNGTDYILNGLSLEIPKGSLTCVIGYSGTGKSVMIKHSLGIFFPNSGTVEVLGQNLAQMKPDDLTKFRCRFGVLFQGAALFDDMTVFENVCFPLFEHRRDLDPKKVREIANEKLKLVGMEKRHYSKLPSEISSGMQKRTGLARALALDPEIVFYDEPTTGLDPILTEMVDNLILNTHRHTEGMTSVVVSHDLDAAFRIADYIAMLDSGRVLLFGTKEDFFNSEIELVKKFIEKGMKKTKIEGL